MRTKLINCKNFITFNFKKILWQLKLIVCHSKVLLYLMMWKNKWHAYLTKMFYQPLIISGRLSWRKVEKYNLLSSLNHGKVNKILHDVSHKIILIQHHNMKASKAINDKWHNNDITLMVNGNRVLQYMEILCHNYIFIFPFCSYLNCSS